MTAFNRKHPLRIHVLTVACTALVAGAVGVWSGRGLAAPPGLNAVTTDAPYANMPAIAPIGVRMDRYAEVPAAAQGPTVDAAKGYRIQKLGDGLYLVTDGGWQSMFMTYEDGVVVVDAPPSYASRIPAAIAEVTDKPITHLVYSHFHADHIGGATAIGGRPTIIAHRETNRLLASARDPNRPLATVTFDQRYRLSVGSQVLDLSYPGSAHAPGNIFIHAPRQRTLMVVDVVFPGWMPWRRLALAQDLPALFDQVRDISKRDYDTLVGGHVSRTGTRADAELQLAFLEDLKSAAASALKTTVPGEGMHPLDQANPWAGADHYIDRVVAACVNQMSPRWSSRLAGFDVFIWDQCYAMEQSLRID